MPSRRARPLPTSSSMACRWRAPRAAVGRLLAIHACAHTACVQSGASCFSTDPADPPLPSLELLLTSLVETGYPYLTSLFLWNMTVSTSDAQILANVSDRLFDSRCRGTRHCVVPNAKSSPFLRECTVSGATKGHSGSRAAGADHWTADATSVGGTNVV